MNWSRNTHSILPNDVIERPNYSISRRRFPPAVGAGGAVFARPLWKNPGFPALGGGTAKIPPPHNHGTGAGSPHTDGRVFNQTNRSAFDPESKGGAAFVVKVA